MQKIQTVADIVEPNGKTIRQNNMEISHVIPLGSLVEIKDEGLRLYVVDHSRDCDGTPLYTLSFDKEAKTNLDQVIREMQFVKTDMEHRLDELVEWKYTGALMRGLDEASLVLIR